LRVAGALHEVIGDGGFVCRARNERATIESALQAAHRCGRNRNDRRRVQQVWTQAFAERCCNVAASIFKRKNSTL